jgi:hypothetical protein
VLEKSGLKRIVIPASVEVIRRYTFKNCKSLESVAFQAGSVLKEIENNGFERSGLKSIVIPASGVTVGDGALRKCNSLDSVTYEAESTARGMGGGGVPASLPAKEESKK